MDDAPEIVPEMPTQCERCKAAAVQGTAFCMQCGAPLEQPGVAAPSTVQAQGPIAANPSKKPELAVLSWLKIVAVLAFACLTTFVTARGAPGAEQVGYCIGYLLIPFLCAFLAARRKPHPLQTFSTWFFCCGLFLLFITLTHLGQGSGPREAAIGDVLREAAGTKPIEHPGTTDDDKIHDIVVGLLLDMIESRKAYEASLAQLKPGLARLHTAESFASKDAMERSIATTDRLLDLDRQEIKYVEQLPDHAAAKINASDLSASQKEDFSLAYTRAYLDSDAFQLKRTSLETELQWASATRALYEFSLQHRKQIRVSGGKVVISDGGVKNEFDSQQANCNELHEKLHTMAQKIAALDNSTMQQAGVSRSDLGLK